MVFLKKNRSLPLNGDLFKYINENLSYGESIELYTCLEGDELKEKNDILNVVVT
jgi:hypothetical protein